MNLGTGEVERTTTNTHGHHEYIYGENGSIVRGTNAKKIKPKKATVLSEDIIEKDLNRGTAKIKRTYSDRAYEIINYNINTKIEFSGHKINRDGVRVSGFVVKNHDAKGITTEITNYNEETGGLKSIKTVEEFFDGKKSSKEVFYEYSEGSPKPYKLVSEFPNGITRITEAIKDKYGFLERNNTSVKHIYPKSLNVKSCTTVVVLNGGHHWLNETIRLRDGRIIEAKISDRANPFEIVVKSKDGKILTTDFNEGKKLYLSLDHRKGFTEYSFYANRYLR